jgi:hypothetical protein
VNTSGAIKQSQFWTKSKLIMSDILTEESILNRSMGELAEDTVFHMEKLLSCLDRYIDKLERINLRDLEKRLEKYAKEPYSKITALAVANVAVMVWMLFSGVASSLLPQGMNVYLPIALGAENEINSFPQGLKPQNNKILEPEIGPESNSFSEVKCEKDKEEGRCSDLCADIEQYIKMTKDMSDEEKRAWQKEAAKLAARKPKRAFSRGISCAEKNDGNPSKSKTKGKHRDEDCCPDPDEWPKPGCAYSASGLALMMSGPR